MQGGNSQEYIRSKNADTSWSDYVKYQTAQTTPMKSAYIINKHTPSPEIQRPVRSIRGHFGNAIRPLKDVMDPTVDSKSKYGHNRSFLGPGMSPT